MRNYEIVTVHAYQIPEYGEYKNVDPNSMKSENEYTSCPLIWTFKIFTGDPSVLVYWKVMSIPNAHHFSQETWLKTVHQYCQLWLLICYLIWFFFTNLNITVFTIIFFLISSVILVHMGTTLERNTSTALVGYPNIFHLFLPLWISLIWNYAYKWVKAFLKYSIVHDQI